MRTKSNINQLFRKIELALLDIVMLLISYGLLIWISYSLGFNANDDRLFMITSIIILTQILVYILSGIYKIIISHFGFSDALKMGAVITIYNIVLMIFFMFFKDLGYLSWSVFFLITPLEIFLMVGPRTLPRLLRYLRMMVHKSEKEIPILIIGAGAGGVLVLKDIYNNPKHNYKVVGFVDDDTDKIGSKLNGVPVYGPIKNIVEFIKKLHVKEVIIAIGSIRAKSLSSIVKEIAQVSVKAKKIQIIEDIDSTQPVALVDVKIEDLLKRDPVVLDNQGLNAFIKNKVVLVTGGGGSIGSELCRQIIKYQPKELIIFDIYENNAYEVQMELKRYFYKHHSDKIKLSVLIGSVYDKTRMAYIYKTFKPNIVFHAAAYKHVPLMEDSPIEALRTNIIGTYYAATLADQYGVDKFVLVSTDKAVRPTNIMGATKRYAENIIQAQNAVAKHTSYSAVRFGNVLGSAGSVIPLFQKQIADGGPVTVTDKEITRYFMTIPEAVSLILLSGVYAKGSEIFVLDMGSPVKIKDLAESMIRLSGLRPYEDIDIVYTGLRPGEKLFEEILIDTNLDKHKPTEHEKIFIEKETFLNFEELQIETLIKDLNKLTNPEVKTLIQEIIKTYQPNGNGK